MLDCDYINDFCWFGDVWLFEGCIGYVDYFEIFVIVCGDVFEFFEDLVMCCINVMCIVFGI